MVPPVPLCAPEEGKHDGVMWGRGGLGSIKTHCGVSGVGHSPAVGTPKAWRGNKDPPMRLHGKYLDAAATATATVRSAPGKCCISERRIEGGKDDMV